MGTPLNDVVPESASATRVAVVSLDAGASVVVETRNSRYRFVVVDGPKRRFIIEGGAEFLEPTPVRLVGVAGGAGEPSMDCIAVGSAFHVVRGRQLIRSSIVRSVRVDPGARCRGEVRCASESAPGVEYFRA